MGLEGGSQRVRGVVRGAEAEIIMGHVPWRRAWGSGLQPSVCIMGTWGKVRLWARRLGPALQRDLWEPGPSSPVP